MFERIILYKNKYIAPVEQAILGGEVKEIYLLFKSQAMGMRDYALVIFVAFVCFVSKYDDEHLRAVSRRTNFQAPPASALAFRRSSCSPST
jgi:hypothetical protein